MFTLVVGGSASGKSAYAESLILASPYRPRYYVAAMEPFDGECRARIQRHRRMRAEKEFETVERYTNLTSLRLPERFPGPYAVQAHSCKFWIRGSPWPWPWMG